VSAFWLDHDEARYIEQVRRNIEEFVPSFGDIAPVTFACAAWRIATLPTMSPPYVHWHRRIRSAVCVRNPWDGTLNGEVTLVSSLPRSLTDSREWWRDRGWQGWQQMFGQFVEPDPRDVAKSPFLRGSLLAQLPLPLEGLPPAPSGPGAGLEASALTVLSVVTKGFNEYIEPIIARLDAESPSASSESGHGPGPGSGPGSGGEDGHGPA
jgi:hypothetical protein